MSEPIGLVSLAVGGFQALIVAWTAGRLLRQDMRKQDSGEQARNDELAAVKRDLSTVATALAGVVAELKEHLIECAGKSGAVAVEMVTFREAVAKSERTTAELQRTIANWMRDQEQQARR